MTASICNQAMRALGAKYSRSVVTGRRPTSPSTASPISHCHHHHHPPSRRCQHHATWSGNSANTPEYALPLSIGFSYPCLHPTTPVCGIEHLLPSAERTYLPYGAVPPAPTTLYTISSYIKGDTCNTGVINSTWK